MVSTVLYSHSLVFYRWHSFINSVFVRHKDSLPEYSKSQLELASIKVNNVSMQVSYKGTQPNLLVTYWKKAEIDLSAGLDFGNDGQFIGSFKHLQHAPFAYYIDATNSSPQPQRGTCRIFLGPKVNEKGRALPFSQQRGLLIEMDKFSVICKLFTYRNYQ